MAFYHSIYGTGVDEDHYLAHRLALAGQTSDVMDLSRITRQREAEIASSLIRYAPARGVGMFQELSQVYGENVPNPHHQQSFESDDGFQPQAGFNLNQGYRAYPYGSVPEGNISTHSFQSSSPGVFGSSGDARQLSQQQQQMIGVQGAYGESGNEAQMPVAHPHDLPTVINRPDLQWLVTTSNVDIRTLTPPSTVSSPHVGLPPLYHNQSSSPGPVGHHIIDENNPSGVTISHHQMHPHYPTQDPPALQRMPKRTTITATGQPKPKGTPGRKRKVPDHELSPAEATKRHIRRERNKVAAAKCRNRRRELTDRLQGETDQLEESQNILHQEIMTLQQEKEHLEFILAAHSPNCKAGLAGNPESLMQHDDHGIMRESSSGAGMPELSLVPPPEVMEETPQHHSSYFSVHDARQQEGRQQVSVITAAPPNTRHNEPCYDVSAGIQASAGNPIATDLSQHGQQAYSASTRRSQFANMTLDSLESTLSTEGSLNTPVCTLATPSVSTGVFTFPSTPGMTCSTATTDTNFQFSSSSHEYAPRLPTTPSYSGSLAFSALHGQPYSCAAAHRRSSSSESHQSHDSVQSPKLLAL